MKRIVNVLMVLGILGMLGLAFIPEPALAMSGSGTAEDPYQIYNVTDLQDMQNDVSAYYVLNCSIDASDTVTWNGGDGFAPISSFTGHFDGQNYTITGLFMDRTGTTIGGGLFGSITGGTVQNLIIDAANVTVYAASTAPSAHAGILAGSISSGLVQRVYTLGVIDGTAYDTYGGNGHGHCDVGGLIGAMTGGTVRYCASQADVTARALDEAISAGGGLIGYLRGGSVYDCYAMGDVTCSKEDYPVAAAGGLIGFHSISGTFTRCYSTGTLISNDDDIGGLLGKIDGGASTCTASFWDKQTSGVVISACGTGKSTTEMKTQSTFTNAGWDFDDLWVMDGEVNSGYPYLLWWYDPPDLIQDIYQVVWFQPNDIIEGTTLPNRAEEEDGIITWGANPAGITMSHGELIPEEEYDFEPVIPSAEDIIEPELPVMTGDVQLVRLRENPLYPLVQILSIDGFLNERLVWLGLAWVIVIGSMFLVHLGPDTHRNSKKPQHFVLTTITGLGLSILFYVMGIFPYWVIIVMAMGLIGAIIWERQPVI